MDGLAGYIRVSSIDVVSISGFSETFLEYKSAFFLTFITPVTARAVFSIAFLICSFVSSSAIKASLLLRLGKVSGTKHVYKKLQRVKKDRKNIN